MNNELQTIITIANDIYSSIGSGYNEVIYHRSFEVALRLNGINYESEVITPIFYKGHNVGHGRVDIKLNNFIIELKAVNTLSSDAILQTKNYMSNFNLNQGVVINFGQPSKAGYGKLEIKYLFDDKIYTLLNGTFVENEISV